jgi:hypothetical protein
VEPADPPAIPAGIMLVVLFGILLFTVALAFLLLVPRRPAKPPAGDGGKSG